MQSQTQSIQIQQPHTLQTQTIRENTETLDTPQEIKPIEQVSQSQETKSPSIEKQTMANEISSTKIWSNIGTGKTKQIREVIQIVQEKSSVSQVDSTENGTEREGGKALDMPYYMVKERPKEEYWNKDSVVANQLYLKDEVEQRQNDLIHRAQMRRLFPNQDHNSQQYRQLMNKGLDILMTKHTNQPDGPNIIRLIDLFYKKFIIAPVKHAHSDPQQFNIYKPDLVRGQKYYSLNDNSLKNESKMANNQADKTNSLKRNPPVRTYTETHGLSLDNESTTNENGDYYQNMAVKYMNGMRKQKLIEPQQKLHFPPRPVQKKPAVRPQLSLPFDIQIPTHTARKQFNPGYNLFQGPDDEKNERFQEERTIAKTFVKDGYGLQIVRNYMPNIDGGAYNRAITTIIRESYKKIEDFLLKQCHIKIHSLTSSEFSLVKTPLVHCRNILTDEDRATFFKYIAITYKFGKLREDIFPTADQTLRLYKAIVRGLNERRAAKEMNPKPNKEKEMYFSR